MVSNSIYPFYTAVCLFGLFVSLVVFFKSGLIFFFCLNVLFLIYGFFLWGKDVYMEGCSGWHNKWVDKGFKIGFVLFIFTEVMFFVCLFWVFLDKVNLGDDNWWSDDDPYLSFLGLPLLGTVFLLMSGLFSSWSHTKYISGVSCKGTLFVSLLFGVSFLCVQYYEYAHLFFNISDGWWGSIFYFLTGCHGFHVCLGVVLLSVCLVRFVFYYYSGSGSYFFEGSVIYWHFVDVVWLVLYLLVYM